MYTGIILLKSTLLHNLNSRLLLGLKSVFAEGSCLRLKLDYFKPDNQLYLKT